MSFRWISEFSASFSTDAHTASRCAVPVFCMLLLAARQEVTKKRAKTFPLGSPLPLAGERHICFLCIARRVATTSGKYANAKGFAGCQGALSPLIRFLATSWGTPRSSINTFTERAKLGEAIGGVAEKLVLLLSLLCYHERQAMKAKDFAFRFCEKFMLTKGALNSGKSFSCCISRAPSVFASFFHLQTQALKVQAFAPQLGKL